METIFYKNRIIEDFLKKYILNIIVDNLGYGLFENR